MNKVVIFFTASYPYGLGEEWKKNEILALKKHFARVHVLPYSYGGNRDNPRAPIRDVIYHEPLFSDSNSKIDLSILLTTLLSDRILLYLREFISRAAFSNYGKFRCWLSETGRIERLFRNQNLMNLLRMNRGSVLYFFWARNSSLLIPCLNKKEYRIACRFHGFDLYSTRHRHSYVPYQSMQIAKSDLLLNVSDHGRRYLINKYHGIEEKTIVSRLGVRWYGKSQESNDGWFRIVSCSRIHPVKRVNLIPEVLKRIKDVRVEWTHIGAGPGLDQIIAETEKLELDNIKCCFTGFLEPIEVRSYYNNNPVDLFINVSSSEGVPVTIMEAMSAEIPVLATDVGGVAEIVSKDNGALLPKDISVDGIKEGIMNFIIMGKEERIRLRKGAYMTIMERFDAKQNAEELAKLLISL